MLIRCFPAQSPRHQRACYGFRNGFRAPRRSGGDLRSGHRSSAGGAGGRNIAGEGLAARLITLLGIFGLIRPHKKCLFCVHVCSRCQQLHCSNRKRLLLVKTIRPLCSVGHSRVNATPSCANNNEPSGGGGLRCNALWKSEFGFSLAEFLI